MSTSTDSRPQRGASLWTVAVVVGIVALTLLNAAHVIRRTPPPSRLVAGPTHKVPQQEARFAGVTDVLRAYAVPRTLGYLADLPAAQLQGNHPAMEEYFATQFVVTPWILDARADAFPWVLANLHRSRASERLPSGYAIVRDFGGGVLLLRKEAP